MFANIYGIHVEVGLGRDNKGVVLAVVGPEVAEGPGHGQEGNLVDRSATPYRTGVS